MNLQTALDALREGDDRRALDALIAGWRASPRPAIADLAVRVDRRLPRVPTTPRDWPDAVSRADPAELGSLCDGLVLRGIDASADRIRQVAALGPDPRIGAALEGLLTDIPWTSDASQGLWTEVFALVERSGDPRFLALRDLPGRWTFRARMVDWLAPRLHAALDALEGSMEPLAALSAEDLEAIGALQDLLDPPADPRDALFAAVWAHPDDDGPRRVLADWLLEQGDPVGELLSVALDPSPEARARLAVLERTLADAGPLEPVVLKKDRVYDRGFLVAAAVRFGSDGDIARLGDHPAWSTLRSLRWAGRPHIHPVMAGLREALDLTGDHLAVIAASGVPWAIERMRMALDVEGQQAFARCPAERLPALRRLELTGAHAGTMRWLYDSPLGGRLTHLDIGDVTSMGQGSIVEWADETEAQADLQEVVLRRFGWTITLRRGPSGRLSDIAFRGSRAETLGYWNLMTLPEDRFTALEVDLDGTPWDAGWADIVEPAVARLRSLERVVTPEGTRTPTPTVALAAAEARRPSVDLGGVSCMAWTADDRLVLAGPGAVVTLDASGQVVHTEQPDEVPTSLAFAGNVSVRATKAGLALGDGRHIPTDPLYNVVLSGDGRLLVGMANTAEIWDLEAGVRLKRMAAKGTWLASTAITPDGALVALGMQNGTIDVRPVEGRKRHPSFHGHTTRVSVLAWSADATRVLSGCDAGTLRCWDAATGEQLWLVADQKPLSALGVTPEGAFVAVDWKEARTYGPDGDVLAARAHPGGRPYEVTLSHDARRMAYRTATSLQIIDLASGSSVTLEA